jgi:hypothetical protein
VESVVAMTQTFTRPGLRAVVDPFTPIGHTRAGPVFRVAGGRGGGGIDFIVGDDDGDDPDFDDEDDDEDEDDDGDEDEPRARRRGGRDDDRYKDSGDGDDTWKPLTREAQESLETALQRANKEAMNRRKVGKMMSKVGVEDPTQFEEFLRSRGIDPDTGHRLDGDDGGGTDDTESLPVQTKPTVDKAKFEREKVRAEQRGAARAEAKYRDAVTLLAAESALRNAGWSGQNLGLALKLIDPERVDVTFDDSGDLTVDGLEEQVEEVKSEFPQWFRPTSRDRSNGGNTNRRERAGARSVDGGNRDRPPARKLGWAEHLSRQIDRGR